MGSGPSVLDSSHDNFTLLDLPGQEPPAAAPEPWRPGCGGMVRTLYCKNCGAPITVPVSCGDRTCPDCRRLEFLRLRRRYLPLLETIDPRRLALVTLTLRLDPADELLPRVERIRRAWSNLVRLQVWRSVIEGGFYVTEIAWSTRFEGCWNVHIHALVEAGRVKPFRFWRVVNGQRVRAVGADLYPAGAGEPLTHQTLKAEWSRLTGGSFVVDITPVRRLGGRGGVRGALCYILKYLAKPQAWPAEGNSRWIYNAAMKRRRIVGTFGRWHKTHKEYRFPVIPRRPAKPCSVCGVAAGWLSEWELLRLGLAAVVWRGDTFPAPARPPDILPAVAAPDLWGRVAATS